MTLPLPRLVILLAMGLPVAAFTPDAPAQSASYKVVPTVTALPAGSFGASLTATVVSGPPSLNFSLCFVTGYGSTTPIVPTSVVGRAATIAFSVPASTIQDVPPSAFAAGSFAASLYTVPMTAASCTGPAPSNATSVTLNYPRLASINLPSAPQLNPKLSSRLPASITLTGTDFLNQTASTPATSSKVTFTAGGTSTSPAIDVGAGRFISPTSLVSTIPTSIDPYVPYVKVQVCNTTALYSYCSNVRNLTLYALPMDDGTVTATPSVALPTQNVTVSATFGSAAPSVVGAPGGLVTFHYASTVLGSAPLTLDTTAIFVAAPATPLQASTMPTDSILADFNQDGVPDLLLLKPGSNTLHLVLGSSPSGSFTLDKPLSPLATGLSILDAAVADLNGDGFPDIALLAHTAGTASNAIYTMLNDGSGNFAAPVAAFASVFGSHILAADFNHDGIADLAIAGQIDATGTTGLQVLLGNGSGHFTAGPATSGLSTAPSASFGGFQIATADFNGDGFPDIAILNGANASGQVATSIQVFQNDGEGNFAAPVTVATDGTPSATFSAAPLAPGQLPALIIAGSTGLSVASNQSAASIAFSKTLPFTAIPGLKTSVIGDFNGDGLLDIAVDDGNTVHVLTGDGKGGFTATYTTLSIPSVAGTTLLAASDVNRDTYADLLSLSSSGNNYTLRSYITAGTATASLPPSVFPVGIHGIVARTPGTFYLECASVGTTLTVNPIATAVSVASTVSSSVTYGQPLTLSAAIPDATATGIVSFYNGPTLLGSAALVDSTTATASFTTRTLSAGAYNVTAVYAGDATHAGASSSAVPFKILPATPTLTWPTPAEIISGTMLSATQLDALAAGVTGTALPGTFVYTPAAGTALPSGTQTLKAVFTPVDATDYTNASASVSINVVPFTLAGLSSDLAVLGDPAKTVTLTGTGFFPTAAVLINGTPIATSFINSTTLSAIVPAANFLTARTLQVAVSDGAQDPVSSALPFYVVAPLASVVFSGPSSIVPGTQITLTFQLTNPYPVPLTATFTLGFLPATGLPADPNVVFSSGGNTFTVVIPANSTGSPQVLIQTGTIAGDLTVGLDLMAGGTDVTPPSVHPLSIQAPASVPGITSVTATGSGNALTVTVRGFSDTREISTAKFHFTPAPGKSIGTQDVAIPVGPIFATWYADPASDQYGSEFTYSQVFNLSSDASVVGQVTVTLVNSVGDSTPVSTQ